MPAPTVVPAVERLEGDSVHSAGRHRRLADGACSCGHAAWAVEHVVRAVHAQVVAPAIAQLVERPAT